MSEIASEDDPLAHLLNADVAKLTDALMRWREYKTTAEARVGVELPVTMVEVRMYATTVEGLLQRSIDLSADMNDAEATAWIEMFLINFGAMTLAQLIRGDYYLEGYK